MKKSKKTQRKKKDLIDIENELERAGYHMLGGKSKLTLEEKLLIERERFLR